MVDERIVAAPAEANYFLKIKYPEFQPADSVGIANINAAISVSARRNASNFESHEWISEEGPLAMKNYLGIDFALSTVSRRLISLRFEWDIYTGGAHSNQSTQTLNYGRDPFRELALEQLPPARQMEDFLKKLSDLSREDLKKQQFTRVKAGQNPSDEDTFKLDEYVLDWISQSPSLRVEATPPPRLHRMANPIARFAVNGVVKLRHQHGTEPSLINFSKFTIDNGAFTFYFDPYHVGSYAEGRYTCRIPITLLRDLTRPDMLSVIAPTD